jgi:hypothetical protein
VTTAIQQLADALSPAASAVTKAVSDTASSTPAQVMALPTSTTPVADVITSVQQMLSTVAKVVAPLVQTAGDLYSLLGVPPTTQQPLIGQGGVPVPTIDFAAPLFGPQTVPWTAVVPAASISGPLFGTMTPPSEPIVFTPEADLAQQMSLSGMASLAPEGIRPLDAKTFLQHVVSAVLVPASLTALAALALPGIGGLLVVSALGMRIGYRQAKAALTMRASGIARFANTGPLGVVRTGALVSLHTRNARADRFLRPEKQAAPVRHLERVA